MRKGEPFVHLATTFRNDGDEPAPLFSYGDIWMRGGRSMRAFVGNTLEPERSRGFRHVSFDPATVLTERNKIKRLTMRRRKKEYFAAKAA